MHYDKDTYDRRLTRRRSAASLGHPALSSTTVTTPRLNPTPGAAEYCDGVDTDCDGN
ncbi:MAG: putative metal-binding motif-containing protein [Deltaproteobacteria bacterium]|nr:putative metal-binding motif-containing protein [Deltaproteobacteria bacterium]